MGWMRWMEGVCEYCIEAEALSGVWDCAIDTPHDGFLTLYITAFLAFFGLIH